ncbi:MAG: sensor domain-containing diguanylate cyclase [Sedimentibacter sp.]|uniref:sensor domain-containing diguanylate cyclase n=1 Tax=Sedimentibacter sp. TaxID=1960295 RepID=UPI003158EA0A
MDYKFFLPIILITNVCLLFLNLILFKRYKNNKEAGTFYKWLLDYSKDSLYYYQTYPDIRFKYISPSIKTITGLDEDIFLSDYKKAFKLVHPDDFASVQKKSIGKVDYSKKQLARWMNSNGEYVWTEDWATPIYDKSGQLIGIVGSMRNITDRIKLEEEISYRNNHDTMTGLFNRDYFEELFDKLDNHTNCKVGIIVCDINGLKVLNDNHGHKTGDLIIKKSAKLLNRYSSENIVISRIGGDEFSMILTDVNESDVLNLVNNIKNDIVEYNKYCKEIKINMSIGYSASENSVGAMNNLFVIADQNMYHSKRKVKLDDYEKLKSILNY